MELYQFKYFIAIYDAKSVSNAASVLHVSQPALSQCIKKMESELRTALFQRPMQGMKLTEVGELVYGYGKEMLKLNQNMEGAISEVIHSDDVEIKVGMSPFYSKHYLAPILQYIRKQFPKITISMVEDISENLENMILSDQLDFCCVPQDPATDGITYEPICMEEILLAVPPDSPVNQHAIPATPIPFLDTKWVNEQKFVSLKKVQKINGLIEPLCEMVGLKREIIYETLDWDTVNIMISNGIGVGFVPDILCSDLDNTEHPLYYRIPNTRFLRHYSIAFKDGKTFTTLERHLIKVFKTKIEEFRNQHICFDANATEA